MSSGAPASTFTAGGDLTHRLFSIQRWRAGCCAGMGRGALPMPGLRSSPQPSLRAFISPAPASWSPRVEGRAGGGQSVGMSPSKWNRLRACKDQERESLKSESTASPGESGRIFYSCGRRARRGKGEETAAPPREHGRGSARHSDLRAPKTVPGSSPRGAQASTGDTRAGGAQGMDARGQEQQNVSAGRSEMKAGSRTRPPC